jgi:hypothetical protein
MESAQLHVPAALPGKTATQYPLYRNLTSLRAGLDFMEKK